MEIVDETTKERDVSLRGRQRTLPEIFGRTGCGAVLALPGFCSFPGRHTAGTRQCRKTEHGGRRPYTHSVPWKGTTQVVLAGR